jgi:DNA (cytosine-5)-methyltransferase 1
VKPRLLDAFCGAGGATRGYQLAGFHVIGVDVNPQPNYCGDEFIQADVLEYLADLLDHLYPFNAFDAVHASPPCQGYTPLRHRTGRVRSGLVAVTRNLLQQTEIPYVIENVPGAPLINPIRLCGSSFGLGANGRQLRRHRLFECSFPVMAPPCAHQGQPVGVYGTGGGGQMTRGYKGTPEEYREAMGIDWATRAEIAQAIPPAYTEHIGGYLLNAVQKAAA